MNGDHDTELKLLRELASALDIELNTGGMVQDAAKRRAQAHLDWVNWRIDQLERCMAGETQHT